MKSKNEVTPRIKTSEKIVVIENPMQERVCGQVAESVEVTAEAILAARRLEVQEETGRATPMLFVP